MVVACLLFPAFKRFVKAGGSLQVWDQPGTYTKFQAIQSYIERPYLQNTYQPANK